MQPKLLAERAFDPTYLLNRQLESRFAASRIARIQIWPPELDHAVDQHWHATGGTACQGG